MKSFLIVGALSASLLLTGCDTLVVDHGPTYRAGYYERGPRYREVDVYHDHGHRDRHVNRREVHRTTNVTNITRKNVNRTVVKRQAPPSRTKVVVKGRDHKGKKGDRHYDDRGR